MDNLKQQFYADLDAILQETELETVTAEGTGYEDLADGYYLCEVEKAELTASKTSGQPMVAFQLKVTENGYEANFKDYGVELEEIKNTKNRKVFVYYVLKDSGSIKRFVADMLKFEGEEEDEPLLSKEYFTTSEVLEESLEVLVGFNIYVHVNTTERKDGTSSTWKNLISWKRARALELPC